MKTHRRSYLVWAPALLLAAAGCGSKDSAAPAPATGASAPALRPDELFDALLRRAAADPAGDEEALKTVVTAINATPKDFGLLTPVNEGAALRAVGPGRWAIDLNFKDLQAPVYRAPGDEKILADVYDKSQDTILSITTRIVRSLLQELPKRNLAEVRVTLFSQFGLGTPKKGTPPTIENKVMYRATAVPADVPKIEAYRLHNPNADLQEHRKMAREMWAVDLDKYSLPTAKGK